jgi:hypothetical protein
MALQAKAAEDTNENPAWTTPKYRILRTMLAICAAQSSQVTVRANGISASVAVLKRHATIAEKKPETETARPNPI